MPYDNNTDVYVEEIAGSHGNSVWRSTDYFHSARNKVQLISGVRDFQVMDQYLFATKHVVSILNCSTFRNVLLRYHLHYHLQHLFGLMTNPDGTMAESSANGLIGTGFAPWYLLQPRMFF